MTQISKTAQRLTLLGIGVTVLATASLTAPAGAVASSQNQFCANLTANTAKVTTKLTDLRTKALAAADSRDQAIAGRQSAWDQKLLEAHAKWDAKRSEAYELLLKKATDGNQRGAVQQYQRTVSEVVERRRLLNDNVRMSYRDAVATALASSRTNIVTDADAFAQKVIEAKDAAAASCKATPAKGADIRRDMMQDLQSARQTFNLDRKDRVAAKVEIQEALTVRNDAIKRHNAAFERSLTQARETLRKAFNGQPI